MDSGGGSAADLQSIDSLAWDAHAQELDETVVERRWSVDTHYGVLVAEPSELADQLD